MKREEINLKGMSYIDYTYNSHEAATTTLINLIYEGGALRPISVNAHELATVATGTILITVHHHDGFTHLITERQDTDHHWHYEWVDGLETGIPHPIITTIDRLNAITAVGGILCLVRDGDILYAPWDADSETYHIISHDNLLYDLTLTQEDATNVTVTAPLPATALRQGDGQKVWQGMENAIDTLLAQRGDTMHKHVAFGIAALRLFDGSLTLFSNIFALLPPTMPQTLVVDAEAQTMQAVLPLHRHFITATMRHSNNIVASLVQGIDIFLTPPMAMLDPVSIHVTNDADDNPTSISFTPLTAQSTMAKLGEMKFHKSITIGPESFGVPMAVRRTTANNETLDISDFHRWTAGGSHAYSYDGRLHIAAVKRTIYSPFDIGLHYRYPTRDNNEGKLCGALPDTMGHSEGITADVVMTLFLTDSPGHVVRFRTQMQYPTPGMMMFPCDVAYRCKIHVRFTTEAGQQQYVYHAPLHHHPAKGFSFACYDATGLPHNSTRPAFLSLLFQQARVIYHDSLDDSETTAYLLWQEETAEEFDSEAAQATNSVMLSSNNSDIHSSLPSNPFVLPAVSHINIQGNIAAITTNTRRSADGQFGDCQYYLFTDEGIYVLKMSANGAWKAHQAVARDTLISPGAIATTGQAVAFISQHGLLLLRGTVTECLSTPLHGCPFPIHCLPRIDDILQATLCTPSPTPLGTPSLAPLGTVSTSVPFLSAPLGTAPTSVPFLSPLPQHCCGPHTSLLYDAPHQRLIISAPSIHPHALVYSLTANSWGTIYWPYRSAITHGSDIYAIHDENKENTSSHILKLDFHTTAPIPIILCTQPLAMGTRHEHKRIYRAEVTGVFHSPTLHFGTALYGSNDSTHWHLIGANMGKSVETWHG
ncbi:MAG: hypothetical protein J6Y23_07885, partial [Prevotella sp.]|nr:hypothetical protein [Prevotella sp.]